MKGIISYTFDRHIHEKIIKFIYNDLLYNANQINIYIYIICDYLKLAHITLQQM